jgi:hypothetical protein
MEFLRESTRERFREHQKDRDEKGIKTGRFRDGLTQDHRGSHVASGAGIPADGKRAETGGDALSDTRPETRDHRDAAADGRATEDEFLSANVHVSILLFSAGGSHRLVQLILSLI